jgi:hypothetical protein
MPSDKENDFKKRTMHDQFPALKHKHKLHIFHWTDHMKILQTQRNRNRNNKTPFLLEYLFVFWTRKSGHQFMKEKHG